MTRFDEPYKTVCFWGVNETSKNGHVYDLGLCKFVEYLRVFATGWRRLIGSPKLQIIFHKRATKCRSLLRKMTYKDEGSYEPSPSCTSDRDTARGLQCPKETCKIWTGRKSIGDTFDDQLFRIFLPPLSPPTPLFLPPLCDGRSCELLNSMMNQICSWNRPHRVVK